MLLVLRDTTVYFQSTSITKIIKRCIRIHFLEECYECDVKNNKYFSAAADGVGAYGSLDGAYGVGETQE